MVRPIDLQDNLSKAPLAGRAQQVQQGAAELAQRQVALEGNQQHVVDQSRTLPTAQTEGKSVNPDEDGEDHGFSRRQRRSRRKNESPREPATDSCLDEEGHINIVV